MEQRPAGVGPCIYSKTEALAAPCVGHTTHATHQKATDLSKHRGYEREKCLEGQPGVTQSGALPRLPPGLQVKRVHRDGPALVRATLSGRLEAGNDGRSVHLDSFHCVRPIFLGGRRPGVSLLLGWMCVVGPTAKNIIIPRALARP